MAAGKIIERSRKLFFPSGKNVAQRQIGRNQKVPRPEIPVTPPYLRIMISHPVAGRTQFAHTQIFRSRKILPNPFTPIPLVLPAPVSAITNLCALSDFSVNSVFKALYLAHKSQILPRSASASVLIRVHPWFGFRFGFRFRIGSFCIRCEIDHN